PLEEPNPRPPGYASGATYVGTRSRPRSLDKPRLGTTIVPEPSDPWPLTPPSPSPGRRPAMAHYLSDEELTRTAPAEVATFASPVPTQIVSNGEFNPLPQTREQQRVEARIKELADELGPRHGMDRRRFLASSAGMAAAFLAMNEVFGAVFDVNPAEAQTPGVANQRAGALSKQFIIDAQTHFVRDDFNQEGLLDLAKYAKQ